MILWLLLLFPLSAAAVDTNQYGSAYDSTLALKPISYVLEAADVDGETFSLKGIITAQCKGDACWFTIKDETGEVLIDLKPYDFRTPLGIVGKEVKLNGRANTKGGKTQVDAISVIIME